MQRVISILLFLFLVLASLLYNAATAQITAGTYTVGALGWEDYSSLTNTGGLFDAINTTGIGGNITIQITSDLNVETGSVTLNQWTGGFSLTIVPQSASVKTITHSGCLQDLLTFDGTDYLTIDGRYSGSGNYLHFVSSCPNQSVMWFDGDCENVTIRNCTIFSDNSLSSVSNGGALHIASSQINGSDNFRLLSNTIEDFSGAIDLFDAIQISAPGNSGGSLDGLEVRENNLKNFNGKAIYLMSESGTIESANISKNNFYATGIISGPGTGWGFAGIQVETGAGHTIRSNYIGGQGPQCSGSKMEISLGSGTQLITFIRMKSGLTAGQFNNIDSNIISNLNVQGSSTNYVSLSLIRIEDGNCNIGVTDGNVLGDITVNASTVSGASIVVQENYSSTSNSLRGIYTTSGGTVRIENNMIGGMLLLNQNASGITCYPIYSSGSSASIDNNVIGGVSDNIVKRADGNFRAIYSDGDDLSISITGNIISGLTTDTDFNDDLFGIYVRGGNGIPNISNNTIQDIELGPISQQPMLYAIRNENPDATISNNLIGSVDINTGLSGTPFYGIYNTGSASNFTISSNTIDGISLNNNSTTIARAIGLYSSGTSDYNIYGNFLSNIYVLSTSNSSYIRGIYINSGITNLLYNNVVLLSNGSANNDLYIYGIYDNASSGTCNIWYNTVDIRGANSSGGSRRSACYYRTGGATRNIQNNLLQNRRVGGSGGHYAIYNNSTTGTMLCNFNFLYADENSSKLVRYSSNCDFQQWQSLGFGNYSVGPATCMNLIDPVTGHQTTSSSNEIANGSVGIVTDHDGISRPLGGGYDIGAFEIDDPMLPPYYLPVELTEFTSSCSGTGINLKWTTASETNNDYFIIESSFNAIDWKQEALVNGHGNSSHTNHYSLNLQLHSPHTIYYRLTQIDFDGQSETFSPIVNNCENAPCISEIVVRNSVVELASSDVHCLSSLTGFQVIDNLGRSVLSGNTLDELSNSTLVPGIYYMQVSNSNKYAIRLIILR